VEKLFEDEKRPLGMQPGNSNSTAVRKISEDVEDALRNAVEITGREFPLTLPVRPPGATKS
jgi:hypothetical protein